MVDLLVLVLLGGAIAMGYRRGFVVSSCFFTIFSLAGLVAAALAVAIGTPPPAFAFLVGGGIALIPPALRHDEIRDRVHDSVPQRWAVFDRVGGATAAGVGVVVLAWFVGAIVMVVPGDSAVLRSVRSSAILGRTVGALPPQGRLGAVILRSGLVPGLNGPIVLAEKPDPEVANAVAVVAARLSVVQVRGVACDVLTTGTAWMAAPGLFVTNAHVVAGQNMTFVASGPSGRGVPARVTGFDVVNDVAVLAVDNVDTDPIPLAAAFEHGASAAVIGFPEGGDQRVSPARLDRVASFDVQPLGGRTPVATRVLGFRALVLHGNSGSPIVLADGSVAGMVVATALGQRIEAGYGVPVEQLRSAIAAGSARRDVSTGPCIDERDLAPGRGPTTPYGPGSPGDRPLPSGMHIPDEVAAEPLTGAATSNDAR